MFTPIQLCILFVITEFLIFGFLSNVLTTIKHCSTIKMYIKAFDKGTISSNEFMAIFSKYIKEIDQNDGKNTKK